MPPIHPGEIVGGRRAFSADTALKLARYFATTARFWLNLQLSHDLAVTERDHGDAIANAVRRRAG